MCLQMKCVLLLLFFFSSIPSSHVPLAAGGAASVARTIVVDLNRTGDFTSIQEAIDSVPSNNEQWIKIHIVSGVYREKVTISRSKSYIVLEGEGAQQTSIEWGDYFGDPSGHNTETSATFTTAAPSLVATGITFKNTYNGSVTLTQAVAAIILGDKSSFYNCRFIGFQDTLFDKKGRHYFKDCYIEGVIDFIFGNGQSIYEGCAISTVDSARKSGYVTAQGRGGPSDPGGFVFKSCNVTGARATYLGRAWGAYSRVIFYQTFMSDIIVPQGWLTWNAKDHEENVTYAESGCTGPGSNLSGRVKWEKTLTDAELKNFTDISYIDTEGWLNEEPEICQRVQ